MMRVLKTFLVAGFLGVFFAGPPGRAATHTDVTINNAGLLLKGRLFAAEGAGPFATVILLHGFPGGEGDVFGIGGELSEAGFNVLTFNYGGSFQSQGEVSLPNAQQDIQAAFDFIRRSDNVEKYKVDTARIILGGYCFGGGMALGYAAGHPEVTAVFSIAGNDHGEFFREYARNPEFQKIVDDMFVSMSVPIGTARFDKGALPKEIVAAGIDKLDPIFDLKASAPRLAGKEILIIGGWNDRQVTIDQFILPFYRALEKAQAKNVKILAFQDDHYFKYSRDELAHAVIEWAKAIPVKK